MINMNHVIVEFMQDMVCLIYLLDKYILFLIFSCSYMDFLGFYLFIYVRVNLSVAIVAMTTPQSLKNQSIEACPSNTNDSSDTPPKVDKQKSIYLKIYVYLFYSMVNLIGILVHKVMYLVLFFMDIFFHNLLEVMIK